MNAETFIGNRLASALDLPGPDGKTLRQKYLVGDPHDCPMGTADEMKRRGFVGIYLKQSAAPKENSPAAKSKPTPIHTDPIDIITEKRQQDPQFSAWENGGLKSLKSTSTITGEAAARNFACKIFFGHVRNEFLESIKLTRIGPNLYRAELKS